MKKQRVVGIVLILIIFTISSCTLTKRHYQPGYHVEWHMGKKVSNLDPEKVVVKEALSAQKSESYYQEVEEPVLIASENSDQWIEYYTSSDTKNHVNNVQKLSEHQSESVTQSNNQLLGEKSLTQKQTDEPVIHWTAGAALGLGILGFVVPFFPSIAAIVFGIVALNKINSEPDNYKGRGLAIAGIVLGALGLVFIIGLAVLMFMAFL
jgi:hypothetical protein